MDEDRYLEDAPIKSLLNTQKTSVVGKARAKMKVFISTGGFEVVRGSRGWVDCKEVDREVG